MWRLAVEEGGLILSARFAGGLLVVLLAAGCTSTSGGDLLNGGDSLDRDSVGRESSASSLRELPAGAPQRSPAVPPEELSLRVSAPSSCSTGDGRSRTVVVSSLLRELAAELYPPGSPRPTFEEWNALWDSPRVIRNIRKGVGSFTLTWEVTGGVPPYEVSFHGREASGASGSFEVTCAREDVYLNALADQDDSVTASKPKRVSVTVTDSEGIPVHLAGVKLEPKRVTVTVTDSEGASAAAAAVVEVIKEVAYNEPGNIITSGSIHRVGCRYAQVPEGMQIVFDGVVNVPWPYGVEKLPSTTYRGRKGLPPPTYRGLEELPTTSVFRYRQVTDGPRATAVYVNTFDGAEIKRFGVLLTTINGQTRWREQRNMKLTPEENALWDQYFNSLFIVPVAFEHIFESMALLIESYDTIARIDPEQAEEVEKSKEEIRESLDEIANRYRENPPSTRPH